jgi:hypothetical protein
MAATVPVTTVSKSTQDAFMAYYESVQLNANLTRNQDRSRLEQRDKLYQREKDLTQEQRDAQLANYAGDADRYQNVTIPVVKTQVETAAEYQASVFLTGDPIFGVVSSPDYIDAAQQLETVIEANAIKGGWTRQFNMFFKDGYKHNLSFLEVSWGRSVTSVIETDLTKSTVEGIPKKLIWQGNTVKRLDPYNTFVDKRVPPTEVYKRGEFAGYTEFLPRIELKQRISELPDVIIGNVKAAFESGVAGTLAATDSGSRSYYMPDINPAVTERDNLASGTNWMKWAGLASNKNSNIDYKDAYELTTIYCRILPDEFGLKVPASKTPQIYKLLVVNHQIPIYIERQTNAHNMIPIFCGQPAEDGLQYQTKSLADDASPFQSVTSAYMNSIIASRRRAISDRVLFDPSRVTEANINSPNPSAKIPVRPAHFGKPVGEAVYAFPYREDQQASNMQQIQTLLGLSNSLAGQNQASQGQFVQGNKTLREFESVMQNANSRYQVGSILYEAQVFTPLKQILKFNTLQYQPAGTTEYNARQDRNIEIDPIALREAVLNFRITDGLIPASKVINTEAYGIAMQAMSTNPELARGYNIPPMFSYLLKTQGADIAPFEKSPEQMAYEQAMAAWQNAVMAAVDKGFPPESIGPQPLPEQFGYDPASSKPSPATTGTPNSAGTSENTPTLAEPAAPATQNQVA